MNHAPHHGGGYENPSVNVRMVIVAGVILAVVVIASLGGLWVLVKSLQSRTPQATSAFSPPSADEFGRRQIPLDPQQRNQKEHYEAEQRELLSSYGWIDRERKIVRIPIDEAMKKLVAQPKEQP